VAAVLAFILDIYELFLAFFQHFLQGEVFAQVVPHIVSLRQLNQHLFHTFQLYVIFSLEIL
jgi:hypothetical protein